MDFELMYEILVAARVNLFYGIAEKYFFLILPIDWIYALLVALSSLWVVKHQVEILCY